MTSDPVTFLAPLRDLAGWVARSGGEACVVAALVLVAQRLLRGRISARWSYNLWLLVLLRLILPALPGSSVSPFNLLPRLWAAKQIALNAKPSPAASMLGTSLEQQGQPAFPPRRSAPDTFVDPASAPVAGSDQLPPIASGVPGDDQAETQPRDEGGAAPARDPGAYRIAQTEAPPPVIDMSAPVARSVRPQPSVAPQTIAPSTSIPFHAPPPVAQPHRWPAWSELLACLWLVGAAVMLVRLGWATIRLSRMIRRLHPVTAPDVLGLLDDCVAALDVRRRPGLLLAEGSTGFGPALVGLWRPRIVLPADVLRRLNRRELRMVLLHELAHLKRRDLAVNWLLGLLQSLHWFNPALWLAFRRIRADREVACDERVLAAASDERRAYAPTILKLLELLCDHADDTNRAAFRAGPAGAFPLAGMVGVLEPTGARGGHPELRQLQRRITMIARYDRHSNAGRRWAIASAAVSLVLGGVALTGAVRADENGAPATAQRAGRDVPAWPQPAVSPAVAAKSAADVNPTVSAAAAATAAPTVRAAATASPAVTAAADRQADPTAAPSSGTAAADVADPTAAPRSGTAAADVSDPFAGRGKEMAELQAKIDARLRELKEHPDRGSKRELELLQSMQKLVQAGSNYGEARRQFLQTSSAQAGAANVGRTPTSAAANGSTGGTGAAGALNQFAQANGAGMAQSHRVGERQGGGGSGAAPAADVIGIVEDQEAQQADERTAAKLRKKVSPQLDGVSLRDALTFIMGQTGAELFTDWRSLEQTSTIPISVAATDIPAEQALDLVLRAAAGDRIGFAIDRGIVVVADRSRIERMVVTRVYDVGDLRAQGDLDDMIHTAVAPSSWIKVKPDASRVGAIQEFGDKLVITQTEPNHRQIVRLLALLREHSNPPAPQRQWGRPDHLPAGANGQGARGGDANPSARESANKFGDMPWADVPPPLRDRAQKLWNEKYKRMIYTQQDSNGDVRELNRGDIERQFRDALRKLEREQSATPDAAQPDRGGTDPNEASGRDAPAATRR